MSVFNGKNDRKNFPLKRKEGNIKTDWDDPFLLYCFIWCMHPLVNTQRFIYLKWKDYNECIPGTQDMDCNAQKNLKK